MITPKKTKIEYEVRSILSDGRTALLEIKETDEETAIRYAKNMVDQKRQIYVKRITTEIIWLNHS